jgi:predicted alpha/beta-fold hydrolase
MKRPSTRIAMFSPTPVFSEIPAFRPHPLLRSGHAQTVFGAIERRRQAAYRATQHVIALDDGDFIVLHDDRPAAWSDGDPVVLLIHGLSGTHASAYVARPAQKLNDRGVRTFRMDLRGCGAGVKLAQGTTHAGRSHDAAAAVAKIASLCPESPLVVIGFSLGGNIVLKMAGEMAAAAPACLRAVLAVAPPIDLAATCRHISTGLNRLYDRNFVKSLLRMVENRRQAIPEARHIDLPRPPRRIQEFDELVTAPLAGFAGAEDYYARSSAAPLLPAIRVPTLILTAADDPLVPVQQFETASYSPAITLHVTEYGGHVGYFGAESTDADRRWLDWRLMEQVAWLTSRMGSGVQNSIFTPAQANDIVAPRCEN